MKPVALLSTLLSTFPILDEMTVKFVWTELCLLSYECCLSGTLQNYPSSIFASLLSFALQSETDVKMGELLRVLLPVFCLYQEGRKMDEKCIRENRQKLLQVLVKNKSPQMKDPIYALIQRLIINTPDRVDDRKNTIDCLMTLLLSRTEEEKKRINTWLKCCGRCGIANIRMCTVCLCTSLLMSKYVSDSVKWQSEHGAAMEVEEAAKTMEESSMEVEARATEQREAKATEQKEARETDQRETEADAESEMEKEAFTGLEKRAVEDDAYEEECTVMERELFFDEKPLYDVFFSLVLGRCQDVVISIRGEATHVWLERCVES